MKKLIWDFLFNAMYQVVNVLAPFITAPYLARVIGAEGLGVYAYTHSVANYFLLAALLGVKTYGNRSIAVLEPNSRENSRVFWEIYSLQFLLSMALFLLYLGYVFTLDGQYQAIYLLQGIYLLSAAFDADWYLFGRKEFKKTAFRNTAVKAINIVLIFLVVRDASSINAYTLVMSLGFLFSALALWPFILRSVQFVRPTLRGIFSHLKPNLILFVPYIAISVFNVMSKIVLGNLRTMTEVGYFDYTYKIISVVVGIIYAFGNIMLPRMSRLAALGENKKSEAIIDVSMQFSSLLSFALSFGLVGVAPHFIVLFLGESFAPCIELTSLYALSMPFLAWGSVFRNQYLIPNNMDRAFTVAVLIGAGVNIALNFLLIPTWGAGGAVLSLVLTECTVTGSKAFFIRKELPLARYFKNSLFPLLAGCAMALGLRWLCRVLPCTVSSLALEVAAGGLFYFMVCGLELIFWDRGTLAVYLRQIVKKRFSRS